ncbi:MAG: hypothetical protein PUE08_07235 [Eubacteriales bacterium]|nr:hypothetical protein [Eubacteriales bacterium]
MGNAYDAYVKCNKAYDAYYYGGDESVDMFSPAYELQYATYKMQPFSSVTYTGTADGHYGTDVAVGGYANMLYSSTTLASEPLSSAVNNKVTVKVRSNNIHVLMYDGTTNPSFPVVAETYKNAYTSYTFYSVYLDTSGFSLSSDWLGYSTSGNSTWPTSTNTTLGHLSSQSSAFDLGSKTYKWLRNYCEYTGGDFDTNYLKYDDNFNFYSHFKGGNYGPATPDSTVYVLNYKKLHNSVPTTSSRIQSLDISNYAEGGLSPLLAVYDAVTSDPNLYFADKTDDNIESTVTSYCALFDNLSTNASNAAITTDSAQYQALRDAFEVNKDCIDNNAMQAYATNGRGYDIYTDTTYADFRTAYENAQAVMKAVVSGGYADTSNAKSKADALVAAHKALHESNVIAPVFSVSSAVIGPNDTITITTADKQQTKYSLAYDGGKDGAETTIAAGDVSIAPFAGSTEYSTVTVTAYSFIGNVESKAVTATFALLKQPTFSVENGAQISATDSVAISTGNASQVGTIEYSFDNSTWQSYTGAVKPFTDGTSAKTIFAREINGSYVSAVSQVSVTRNTDFAIACSSGTSFYNPETDRITITTPETYNGTVKYTVTDENGSNVGLLTEKTYNDLFNENGIACSKYDSQTTITIEAWGVNDGVETEHFTATFINKVKYSTNLIYQESFDENAAISDRAFTSDNGNGTLSANAVATIESGAGVSQIGEWNAVSSYRTNVLKFAKGSGATNDDASYITLENNPLTTVAGADVVSSFQGVTISFWRYIENDGTVVTDQSAWNNGWMPGLSFSTKTGASDTSEYEYLKILSSGYVSRCDKTVDGVGGNGYIDIKPDAQDVTGHATGNDSGYWVNVAVSIDPNSGVKIYTNGNEHNVTIQGEGKYLNNNGSAAKEIIKFLIADTTEFSICDGTPFWANMGDFYFDDIRIYSEAMTQVDVLNMYNDENADVPSTSATSHDPTAVTVYTLANGTQVGEEYIEKNSIDVTSLKKEYYLFGTGMTIQKSTDGVNWEYVGDSQGRCGYQNHDLFGAEYHTALAVPLAFAAKDSNRSGAGDLVWAPHVMYNVDMGKWVYYGSTSSWGSGISSIFMGVSDNITGPYTNIQEVFKSDTWSQLGGNDYPNETALGYKTPCNAIDPAVYYSADYSKMYMVYGSWNSGIAVKEMDKTTGLSTDMSDAGTVICWPLNTSVEDAETGSTSQTNGSGEGAWVTHETINGTTYYYLYVSYGSNDGSYSERVFRSTEPNTGFVDIDGTAADNHNEGSGVHGNQLLSPFYLPAYDYTFVSTGHNSVSYMYNANGERVTTNSVHARPISTDEYQTGKVANTDGVLATKQIDISGNTTLINLISYTQSGWPVLFPLQYNGTDTDKTKLTAYDIEGIYTNDNLRLTVNMNHSKCFNCYFLATSETEGIAYGTLADGSSFSHGFELTYGDDGTCYITVKAADGSYVLEGVFATQTKSDGTKEIMYGMVNTSNGECSWGYRSGNIPEADQESAGDVVTVDEVIYTHLVGGSYAKYGIEISDNRFYSQDSNNLGERCTKVIVKYPYYIDTSFSGSVYCISDETRCLNDSTLSGGDYGVSPMANNLWIYSHADGTGATVNEYLTDAQAANIYAANPNADIVKAYVLSGYVSNYFKYNESTGKYTEDGIELLVTYKDVNTGASYGEYEFCYVMPNPGMAHTIQGIRNTNAPILGASKRVSKAIYSRFIGSEGYATDIISSVTDAKGPSNKPLADNLSADNTTYRKGVGNFKYLADFGSEESINANGGTNGTQVTPSTIEAQFDFYDKTVGTLSGSYGLMEFDESDNGEYTATSSVVDANYYIDYSSDSDLITRDSNGIPTGYKFNLDFSNLYWTPKNDESTVKAATSYANNRTGLLTEYTVTKYDSSHSKDNVTGYDSYTNADLLGCGNGMYGRAVITGGFDDGVFDETEDTSNDIYSGTSRLADRKAFAIMDTGYSTTDSYNATVTFSGKDTVKKSTNTTSAETYANYIIENGIFMHNTYLGTETNMSYELYTYYNIGVATCDKGAVRTFADMVLNKELKLDSEGKVVLDANGMPEVIGDLNSGEFSVSSYREYLDAIAQAYWFVENTHNTTYNGTGADAVETKGVDGEHQYTTAYTDSGEPIFNTTQSGSDIFKTGTTTTDPVQARIVQNVIAAYEKLFTVEEYQQAVEDITAVKETIDKVDTSEYTSDSVADYNAIIDFANNYINYSTNKGDENYWRYAELTGAEYEQLVAFVDAAANNLMPLVDATGEVVTDKGNSNLSGAVTDKTAYLSDNESSVFYTTTIDDQDFSFESFITIQENIEKANQLIDSTKNSARYDTDADVSAEFLGTEYTYTPIKTEGEAETPVLSADQQSIVDLTAELSAQALVSVDDNECYQNYNYAQSLAKLADLDAYADNGEAINNNFEYGLINDAPEYVSGINAVYVTYNDKVYKYTGTKETDPYTTDVLNDLNTNKKTYKVTFNYVVNGATANQYTDEIHSYGDIVKFDYIGDASVVTWEVEQGGKKVSVNNGTSSTFSTKIQTDTTVNVYVTTTDCANYEVQLLDYFGRAQVIYVPEGTTVSSISGQTITFSNGETLTNQDCNYYTFTNFTVGGKELTAGYEITGNTVIKANGTKSDATLAYTVTNGKFADGTDAAAYKVDDIVTVAPSISDCVGIALVNYDGSYTMLSYGSSSFTFYAFPVTEALAGGVKLACVSSTDENLTEDQKNAIPDSFGTGLRNSTGDKVSMFCMMSTGTSENVNIVERGIIMTKTLMDETQLIKGATGVTTFRSSSDINNSQYMITVRTTSTVYARSYVSYIIEVSVGDNTVNIPMVAYGDIVTM